jgi:hypothetical protein
MDVGAANFGTVLAAPPGVVTGESGGLPEPDVADPPDPITILGEELDPATAVLATGCPEVETGALTKADAGSP